MQEEDKSVDIDTSGPDVEVELPQEKKEIDESSKLPEPTGWRILVLPFKQKEKTKGGLI